MSSNIVEIQETEENKENNKSNNEDLTSKESSDINDNETNKFYHDKDIYEDSIIYFTNKLKVRNKNFKFILYLSILLYLIDLLIFFERERILYNIFNFLSIVIILFSSLYQAFTFRHDFQSISKELYNFTQKVIYINIGIFSAFIINMAYIIFSEIDKKLSAKIYYEDKSYQNIMISLYCFINIFMPSIHLYRLISIKTGIKELSSAKGEIYESARIEEVEIINSVINEI